MGRLGPRDAPRWLVGEQEPVPALAAPRGAERCPCWMGQAAMMHFSAVLTFVAASLRGRRAESANRPWCPGISPDKGELC